jgi:hypothetical protein
MVDGAFRSQNGACDLDRPARWDDNLRAGDAKAVSNSGASAISTRANIHQLSTTMSQRLKPSGPSALAVGSERTEGNPSHGPI